MNGERYLTVLIGLCCIAAAGVAATTLNSSLEEDPDDVIDLDYDSIPLGKDEAGSLKREAQQNKDDQNSEGSASSENGEADREGASNDPGSGEGTTGDDSGTPKAEQGSGDNPDGSGGEGTPQGAGGGNDDTGMGTAPGSAFVLFGLEYLLALLALLVAAALAYRYRDHLLALALAVVGLFTDRSPGREEEPHVAWPRRPPEGDVKRAWLAMVERVDIDRPYARTPSECARAAIDAGLNPDAVRTLTATFEEVRYGNRPETDDHRRRAREGLRGLDGGESL